MNTESKAAALTFPCASCGSGMTFDPASRNLVCPNCGGKKALPTGGGAPELTMDEAFGAGGWDSGELLTRCSNCGAEIVVPAAELTARCAWCGSDLVKKTDGTPGIKPGSLVPFSVARESAVAAYRKWISKRAFAPGKLKQKAALADMAGCYLPAWTFDARTISQWTAEAGTHYMVTVERTVNGQSESVEEQRTRWAEVAGNETRAFDDILVNAGKTADETLWKRIMPFDLGALAAFEPGFLAGFRAIKAASGIAEGWESARSEIDRELETAIRRAIRADEVRNLQISTWYLDIKWRSILLPVWVASYLYGGRAWRFLVNGQSGKVQGYAPVSAVKVTLLTAGILIITAAIFAALQLTHVADFGAFGVFIERAAKWAADLWKGWFK